MVVSWRRKPVVLVRIKHSRPIPCRGISFLTHPLFLLARHGQTKLNKDKVHVGQLEASLDDEGLKEAQDAGEFISHLPISITHVIASPLTRTQETAAIICDILGIDEYYTDDRLKDLDVGDLSGKSEINNPLDEYIKDPDKKVPGGESVNDFRIRQLDFANELVDKLESDDLPAGSILIVTHSPVIGFWHNLQSGKKNSFDEDVLKTGGVAEVTDNEFFPLFRKNQTPEEKQDDKMDPAVVLYMPPESLGEGGAKCGTCILGLSDNKCAVVHADDDKNDTSVSLKYGVCGLYAQGKLDSLVKIQPIISRTEAGYINKGAPTNCGKCQYFTKEKEFGCTKIDGRKTEKGYIEAGGCCNRWEEK